MKHGGQAFPGWMMGSITHDGITHPSGPNFPTNGMTMRQWYKGMALAGMMANSSYDGNSDRELANMASNAADALLAEDEEASRGK